jgi:hypothetical protein
MPATVPAPRPQSTEPNVPPSPGPPILCQPGHDGVVEGRRIFANTIKYVLMGTSSNFGNMFSAAGASLLLGFLPMLPPRSW